LRGLTPSQRKNSLSLCRKGKGIKGEGLLKIMDEPITTIDEFETEYKKGIGVEIDLSKYLFLTEATRDNIMNFADAIGDNNPLWTNEEYARKSRFGMIIAPPTFLYNVNHGSLPSAIGTITRPIHNQTHLYAGAEFEFFRPIWLGDRFTVKGKAVDVVKKTSKSVGSMLFVTGEASYFNQRKELIGILRTITCRYTIPGGQAIASGSDRKSRLDVAGKSPDLLAFERKRQGAEPRYWEDVEVGEEMTPLEKGILTMTEIYRFGLFVSPSLRRIESRREIVEVGFEREKSQKRAGLENASDYGPQRICWVGQFLTDWMGDDGTLKKFSVQIRYPNIIGDINVVKGKLTNKYISNGEHLVDCEMWVENQTGLITAPGKATIALPSKS
jgi:acyl dehydratase